MPGWWTYAKRDSSDITMGLNGALTGYAGTAEQRAQARAAMQVQTQDLKLSYALRAQEIAAAHLVSVATVANTAERQAVRRSWIFWAAVAFTPTIIFGVVQMRRVPPAAERSANPEVQGSRW
jgi:hypothetical protein